MQLDVTVVFGGSGHRLKTDFADFKLDATVSATAFKPARELLQALQEWPTHLCLSSQYHIPSTTRVSRQAVLASPKLAAQDAWHALKKLIEAQGRTPPEQVHAAVGSAWLQNIFIFELIFKSP